MKKRILLVEDDQNLSRVLSNDLRFSGFEVHCAGDGDQAVEQLRSFPPDLVLLDVVMPGKSGFDLCGWIRRQGRTPVIMLTARDQAVDKIQALELGADDYVTKPFNFDELRARIRAVLRRARLDIVRLSLSGLTIDFEKLRANNGRREIHLTRREFDLLFYLAERRGSVVHRDELLREVWGYPLEPKTRAVDSAIKRLRQKIERDSHHPRYIHTVQGDGYCLTFDDAESSR